MTFYEICADHKNRLHSVYNFLVVSGTQSEVLPTFFFATYTFTDLHLRKLPVLYAKNRFAYKSRFFADKNKFIADKSVFTADKMVQFADILQQFAEKLLIGANYPTPCSLIRLKVSFICADSAFFCTSIEIEIKKCQAPPILMVGA
ncbi:hypothetical protein [Neobacillus drentensis]|uniref:hypothetical protein n=1 Tax=Neobacillus drentensis TaxID=220684 RepID=UPI003002BBF9